MQRLQVAPDCLAYAGPVRIRVADQLAHLFFELFRAFSHCLKSIGCRRTGQVMTGNFRLLSGILRSILSYSEFASDPAKTGWKEEELKNIAALADSCAASAGQSGVQFILENIVEPWFGAEEDKGLDDFFSATSQVGLQFDTANPFLSSNRRPADPDKVAKYLGTLKGRWVTTHLKSGAKDSFQPSLRENFIPYEQVFRLMAGNGVRYAALELWPADGKDACMENHRRSIEYLEKLGIVTRP